MAAVDTTKTDLLVPEDYRATPLTRLPATADIDSMLDAFNRDGGLIVEGIFDTATIAQLAADFESFANQVEPGSANQGMGEEGKIFVGANTIRFSSLGQISSAYFDLLDNEVYAALSDAILLPNCGSYWVNTGQAMYIGPGETRQVLHRDANNWWQYMTPLWPDCPEVTVSAMIALEAVTDQMGATRVVPGSHRWPTLERWSHGELDTVPAEMQPGDAFIYSGKVLHAGGANQTADRWRKAMHLSFVAGWLTPEEANPLDYTTEDLAECSDRVRRLLGHSSYDSRPHQGGGLWLKHVKDW